MNEYNHVFGGRMQGLSLYYEPICYIWQTVKPTAIGQSLYHANRAYKSK